MKNKLVLKKYVDRVPALLLVDMLIKAKAETVTPGDIHGENKNRTSTLKTHYSNGWLESASSVRSKV